MHAETGNAITIRFALPAPELRPYVTTYYRTDAVCSPSEPYIEDYLHPEWSNLRILSDSLGEAAIGSDPLRRSPDFAVTGPTSRSTRFRIGSGRSWGIGLLPLGWAALIGAQACDYADRFVDGFEDSAFAGFRSLAQTLSVSSGDFDEELALIEAHMGEVLESGIETHEAIAEVNAALVDPEIGSVAGLADRVGMNVRSLERLSLRAFGFPPKILLRRQRFLRSLAQFMLDPSMKWLKTLDYQYHDQAHFVRDFQRFMGMSPSEYARLDKPILIAAARARMEIAGEAVQGLHRPSAAN
ncbi:helix-turn-helix domain-containing protein [Erythrobacter sp. GH1-10]|uniref:AraC family transcriptional regulator n=1 Tax=Erythrobacter sp. GH1-10 TaxID=3349334 RepID=UPI00387843F5